MGCNCSSHKQVEEQLPSPPKSPTPEPPELPPLTPIPSPVPPKNPPDLVTKEIDNRKDEHPVQLTEDDAPAPAPPENSSDEVKPTNKWFEDEDFSKGSDEYDEKIHEIETASNEFEDNLSMILRPKADKLQTRTRPKISFQDIDQHAKTADASVTWSFHSLLDYLTRPIESNDPNKEMLTARAIVAWLAQQDIDNKSFGEASLHTPNGLLQYLKGKRMTYATCYTRLCREAKIKCTLVAGLVRAASYEPGNKDAPSTQWTAVYVDGGWQLVHPFWICRALYGHSLGGWIKIEADGTTLAVKEDASSGVVRNTFQEHYFMPKPQHFIYECFATDTPWQLLPSASVVRSKKDFLELPYLLPPFFGIGLELISERSCSLTITNGTCKIVMKANPRNAHKLVLQYELFVKATGESSNKFKREFQMSRMVFNTRSNEWFEFDIRFPEPGEFKFIVYGGPYKSPALRLCEFQLLCKTPMKNCVLLPLACDKIGWGPGPASVDAGLLLPTRVSGMIHVSKMKPMKTEMKFQINPKVIRSNKYMASLHRQSDIDKPEDEQYTTCNVANHWLVISVTLPAEGEFGLSITCIKGSENGSQKASSVCNYLLSTTSVRYLKANVKIAKQSLLEACDSQLHLPQKVELMQVCIDKCRKQKVDENDEDFCAALAQFEYFYYKNELRWATMRDNLSVALRTLHRLSSYKYRDALHREIRQVETTVVEKHTQSARI